MSLLETYLQDIRAKYPSMLDRDELRLIAFGLVDTAFAHTASPQSILSEDVKQKAKRSVGRLLAIPVITNNGITIGNTRSCTITDYENDSALVNVVFSTLTADITMVPAQYAKNEIAYIQDFARKIIDVKEGMLQVIEDAIFALLDANKTVVFASTLVGVGAKYPLVADTLQVAFADQEFFFNDIRAIQAAGEFRPALHFIDGSVNLMPTVEQFINQGKGNSTNQEFQFADKVFRFSNGVVDGAGVRSTGFFMPNGTIGIMTRVDLDAMNNSKSTNGTEWSTTVLDGMPFEIGVQFKSDCSDESALNTTGQEHLDATLKEFWQFSVDFALLTPFIDDPATEEGSIKKFEFLP